jgi:endonuclease/exonuclease/phosphatase family metal-dependent hydrolase
MKIGSWNLLHGMAIPQGGTSAESLLSAAAMIDLDLLALQEVDFFQDRSNTLDQTALIAQGMDAQFYDFTPAIFGTPGEKWIPAELTKVNRSVGKSQSSELSASSKRNLINQNSAYGISLISKIPIDEICLLELGQAPLGIPLVIPNERKGKMRPRVIYVSDEPRIAQAAILENGVTVINTHLSFVPGFNLRQLRMIKKWAKSLPGKKILIGDLNLPGKIPAKVLGWNPLIEEKTYPSWKPRIQFDHALSSDFTVSEVKRLQIPALGISDHLPIAFEIL